MTHELLELTVVSRRDAPGVMLVRVAGDVDAYNAPALSEALTGVTDAGPIRVDVDLSAVTFFSRAGLGVLVTAREHVDGRLSLVEASLSVRRLLRVLDLERSFGLAPSMPARHS
jgi:anti-sigma B factor antagonist